VHCLFLPRYSSTWHAALRRAARPDQRFRVQGTLEVDLCFQRMILDTPPFLDRTQFSGRPSPLSSPASEHDTLEIFRVSDVSANTAKIAGRPAEHPAERVVAVVRRAAARDAGRGRCGGHTSIAAALTAQMARAPGQELLEDARSVGVELGISAGEKLAAAAGCGDVAAVQLALLRGADANHYCSGGRTPLFEAAYRGPSAG
jgi:hypothetical protein